MVTTSFLQAIYLFKIVLDSLIVYICALRNNCSINLIWEKIWLKPNFQFGGDFTEHKQPKMQQLEVAHRSCNFHIYETLATRSYRLAIAFTEKLNFEPHHIVI